MIDLDYLRRYTETTITMDKIAVGNIDAGIGADIRYPIQYENVPNGGVLDKAFKDKKPWIRVVIREGEAFGATVGDIMRRYPGHIMCSMFVKQEEGTAELRKMGSLLSNYIVNNPIKGVLVFTPTFAIIGKSEDWFMANLSIPFHFDQFT